MKLTTIRGQLTTLLGSFFLLVIVSVGVMFWSATTQKKDALIINLAGRQRMLTQKLTWLALVQPGNPDIAASIELFEQTLHALRFGGVTTASDGALVSLPPAPDPALRSQLDEVSQTWESFRRHLLSPDASDLPAEAPLILEQLDEVVSAFEARAEAKHLRLVWIQAIFLAAALTLLAWGFLLTRRRIVSPLANLGAAVRRMGAGDLAWPLPSLEDDELGELAGAFETMRAELAAARASLEARMAQRTRELVTAFEFSQEIVSQRKLNDLMDSVVERARRLMQAQSAALCVLTPDNNALELVANSGVATIQPGLKQTLKRGPALSVIGENQVVNIESDCADCSFLRANIPGRCVAIPLRAAERTLGALCVVRSEGDPAGNIPPFDAEGLRALSLLANAAAIAITNARLATAERQQAEQAAALAEREQLAADLHDNLAQTLSYTRLKLGQLEEKITGDPALGELVELEQIEGAIDSAYQQVRAALVGLLKPPPAIDDFTRKLSASVEYFRDAYGLPVELTISDPALLAQPPLRQDQILHFVREALSNVQRHARARHVWVRVEQVNDSARFTVEDDGAGFDPQAPVGKNNFGLRIMRTRIERSGGEFSLSSAPGKGARITASFPLKAAQKSGYQTTGGNL